jgi:uracil-DNA glycosylase family protein
MSASGTLWGRLSPDPRPVLGVIPAALEATMAEEIPPSIKTLSQLRGAEAECTRCPLYRFATQVVPGEGPSQARFMLVGEQPGDKEDIAGKPFVGPAGRILDQALEDAGIPRKQTFVTNAVKHFKFEQRGKRRLHKRPNAHEIERCKWWNDMERLIVKPDIVVALGATAARSLLGRPVTIASVRGDPIDLQDGSRLVVTIHPSALLRTRDEADKREKYRAFVKDLKAAARFVFGKAA